MAEKHNTPMIPFAQRQFGRETIQTGVENMPLPRYLRIRLVIGLLLALVIWLVTLAHAATVRLTWDAPIWPADQTQIPLQNYILERDGAEIARPLTPPYSDTVPPGVYIYAVRALYEGNQLSARSNALMVDASALFPPVPAPINLTCVFTQPPNPTLLCQAMTSPPPGPYPRLAVGAVQVQGSDSQEIVGEDGHATNAADGQVATIWHTQWQTAQPPLPHLLTLDLGTVLWVDGLAYLPRQTGANGVITSYRLESSSDLTTWIPFATGTWALDATEKTIRFPAIKGRYIRLVALASNGTPYASAAEVGIFAVPAP